MFENDYLTEEVIEEETENEEKDLNVDCSTFSQAVIWGTDWTTETIALQLEKGNIDLNPSFQRRDAWTDIEKSKLIESLMLGLPVPPIILAENKDKKNSYIVIDGKQRLLSIRRFYSDITEKEFKEKNLSEKTNFKQLKLKGLEILKDINNMNRNTINDRYNDLICSLENQPIRTIIIKNWPDESFLYTVFLRLNTGSKRLSPQELRQALIPGHFLNYLDDATSQSNAIRKMLHNKGADTRMKDVELALRYYAFKLFTEDFNGSLKLFLDDTCKKIDENWGKLEKEIISMFEQLEKAIEFVCTIFDNNSPFSRYTHGNCNNRFNRPIFEIFTYYFSDESLRNVMGKTNINEFKEKFIELNDNIEFISAVSDTTKDIKKITARFSAFSKMLSELSGLKNSGIMIPTIEEIDGKLKVKKINL